MAKEIPFERFRRLAEKLGLKIDESAQEKFKTYHSLLLEWGGKINLYSQNDRQRLLSYHFLDSILPLKLLPEEKGLLLADIGSGAGFPAIPIKIMRPDLKLLLFEARKKKALFLFYVIKTINLSDTTVIDRRVEDWEGEKFDIATIRLLGDIKDTIPLIAPHLKEKAQIFFYKGSQWEKELKEGERVLKKFNLSLLETHTFHLSHLKLTRRILILQK
ncbi:MAG: 16S rRNA (guanine(527)-N(7))-methyltransferase RsmG [candidate division WOR-3 bacterium]